jgi:biopolymer transport protein ExbB
MITLIATVPAPAETPANPGSLSIDTVFDFVTKGGPAMIAIGLCSVLAVTIVIERLIVLRKSRVVPGGFVERVRNLANDRPKALELARRSRSPIANILEVALRRADEPQDMLEKHVEEAGGREVALLRQRMRVLSALPQVSTMLGLLGTVFGMIKTFQAVSASSEALGKTEMLAEGIFEAWTCTAAGLIVAIPVMLAYHYLMGRIDSLVIKIDEVVVNFLERMKPGRIAAAGGDARSAASPYRSVEESMGSI